MLCQNDSRMTRGGRDLCHDPDSGEGRTEAGVESGSPLELLSTQYLCNRLARLWRLELKSFARDIHL